MSRLALLVPFLAFVACGLDKSGALEGPPDTGVVETGVDAPPDVVSDVISDVEPDVPAPCMQIACPSDQYCRSGACDYLESCDQILAAEPSSTSRLYAIRTASMSKLEGPIVVACEMQLPEAPGGWTLFARTAANAVTAFGWNAVQSDISAAGPYAFDLTKGLAFTHGLVAQRMGKLDIDPAGPLITFDFPKPFPGALGASTTPTSNLAVVRAAVTCTKTPAPSAFTLIGNTDQPLYFFSDQGTDVMFGLTAKGFFAKTTGCDVDQNLNGKQAFLFVR
ncbi:hypothetical protein BH09MYX1_BH09MYX1_53460 [soil metagenome]